MEPQAEKKGRTCVYRDECKRRDKYGWSGCEYCNDYEDEGEAR